MVEEGMVITIIMVVVVTQTSWTTIRFLVLLRMLDRDFEIPQTVGS